MAKFNINYDIIRQRIREVSTIDTETVTFVEIAETDCPDCQYDPINKESVDANCPTCGGTGVVESEVCKDMTASVDRVTGFESQYEPGGRLNIGDIRVTIHESELARVGYDVDNTDWVSVVDRVEIANKTYIIAEGDKIIPQTLQGEIYEIIFNLSRKKTP